MSDYASHEAPAHEAGALPVMLPPKLIGREAALAQVYGQLKQNNPVLIYGQAGVGKTALAATLASAYAQQPGGVLWLNVDQDSLESLLVRVGRAYHIDEVLTADNPLGLVGAVATTLTQHKPLIVLDGPIDAQIASKFITRVADRLPVVLISRTEMDGPWTAIPLPRLGADQAAMLFRQEGNISEPGDAALLEIVKVLDYLPFAISVGARAMLASRQTPAAYTPVLAQLIGTTRGDVSQAALTAGFSALTGALQGVLLMMGATFTGEGSDELLSIISGAPVESVQQAMNILVGLRLVERSMRYGIAYYRLHPLTYQFVHSRLESSDRLESLQNKVLESVLVYAEKYSEDSTSAHNKLATEMDNFLAAAYWAADVKDDRSAADRLAAAVMNAGDFISARGYGHELGQLRGTGASTAFPAYPEDIALTNDDDEDDAQASDLFAMLDGIGDDDIDEVYDEDEDYDFDETLIDDEDLDEEDAEDLYDAMLRMDEENPVAEETRVGVPADMTVMPPSTPAVPRDELATLRAQLTEARQSSDQRRIAQTLSAIGQLQVSRGMEQEAIATYNEALNLYETLNDERGTLATIEALSALMVKTENAQAAILNANRGLQLAQRLNANTLPLLITLGDAHQDLGESVQAATTYRRALNAARDTGDAAREGVILYKLGLAQLDSSEAQAAIETFEQALALFKAQDQRDYEGRVLGGLGSAYGDLERWAEAINFHMSALYIAREVGDRDEEALQLSSLGYASMQAGQLGDALLRYRQALHLAYLSEDKQNIVSTLVDVVQLLLKSRRHLAIGEMLIDEAMRHDGSDKDVRALKERVTSERMVAEAEGVQMMPVNGDAERYASNAYRLLDE